MRYPTIDIHLSGKRLKAICEDRNVSVRELQKMLNLGSVQAVYNWFSGERLPNIDNLFAISKMLDVKLDDLLVEQKLVPYRGIEG